MAPNPIMIPRKRESMLREAHEPTVGLTTPILFTSLTVLLAATLTWARRWVISGAAIESLILVYGSSTGTRLFPEIPIWTLLASINVIYAVSSTSWLLYGFFTATCYPTILLTCIFQFKSASNSTRKWLRKLLRQLHFTRDTIAFFNVPALEIDTDVDGLFVVRGLSISLSSLTIVVHGVELGLKLSEDMEIAIYTDKVTVKLFRGIEIGDVYGNLKGGKAEMTFGDLENVDTDDDSVFQADTALLRAATGLKEDGLRPPRPDIHRTMTGGSSQIKDSTVRESIGALTELSPDDEKADKQYKKILKHIKTSSPVEEARRQADKTNVEDLFSPENDKDMRAAICAKLQEVAAVPHPPSHSVRVTTLQKLTPDYIRNFLHRLPFLLRLLLMPLSYFHPVTMRSINGAASGQWVQSILHEKMFKHYGSQDKDIRKLERKISNWLTSANFSLLLSDISALGQVPLSSTFDIVAYLKFADMMVYRTVPDSGVIRQVARLAGADATFTIPSFLLPHHEHILPTESSESDLEEQQHVVDDADGMPKTIEAEKMLGKMAADEAEINLSVHVSLPAHLDQTLLEFVAALVKAMKVIELEKMSEESEREESESDVSVSQPTSPTDSMEPFSPPSRTGTGFKSFASGIRQNIKDKNTGESIMGFARNLNKTTRDGMKKAASGMVSDGWIAKIVSKLAVKLEHAQGDLGYSGGIPVPLAPYRPSPGLPSKLLP